MKTTRFLGLLSICATAACTGAPDVDTSRVTTFDGEATLSADNLSEGAPSNDVLPDEAKSDAVFPRTFDLVADQSVVKSQGGRGVCSIFSTVGLMEHLYIKAGMSEPDFSEQYLQWSVKSQFGTLTTTEGSNASSNINAIAQFGIPRETAWPYESVKWNTINDPLCTGMEGMPTRCFTNGEPPATAVEAQQFRLPAGKFLNSSERSIKAHMTSKNTGVVVGGTFFYQAWNHRRSTLPTSNEYWRKGYVLSPNAEDVTASTVNRAGHSFLLVGWDDNLQVQKRDKEGNGVVDANGAPVMEKGFFLFKNSWGTAGFGIENPFGAGYGWISYAYVRDRLTATTSRVPSLIAPPQEICGDGQDNDSNGKIDCLDDRCSSNAECQEPVDMTTTSAFSTVTAIPDNLQAGILTSAVVQQGGAVEQITLDLDVTHTYRGDLEVTLTHAGREVRLLEADSNDAEDNLVRSFAVVGFEGVEAAGEWVVRVADVAREDTGALNSWTLTITR